MAGGWRLFSVKTVYVTRVKGRPKKRHRLSFGPKSVLVEERIVLFKARSHREALRRAEEDARRYVEGRTYTNPYGLEVDRSYSGVADSHELFADEINSGIEVFSSTRVLPGDPNTEAIANLFLGPEESEGKEGRLKFLNSKYSGWL